MFEVRGNRERLKGIVGKLLGKKGAELLAKFFARQLPCSALEFATHKFQPVRLGAPEPLHGQDQPLFRVVRNRQHAPRDVEAFRPKMQKRFFAGSSDFPGQTACEGSAAAILVQIHESGGQKFFQARFEFGGEVHAPIITK